MNNIQLHVGYIGITREGKRVEITGVDTYKSSWPWESYDGEWYTGSGAFWSITKVDQRDIVGPYEGAQQPMLGVETPVVPQVNYNDGKWHRWDGATAECPVHKDSTVEVTYMDQDAGIIIDSRYARNYCWNSGHGPILAFRVTKEYVAPVEPREFWIMYSKIMQPRIESHKPLDTTGYIHVKEVTNA